MIRSILAATLIACSTASVAQVTVKEPWVRAALAQQTATGAFMQLSTSAKSRLVEVRSAVAGVVEIHEMKMDGDVMRMRAIDGIDIAPGQPVELKPGGYHVMLMDLKQPLQAGDTVAMTMVFEGADRKRQTLDVQAPVRALNASTSAAAASAHDHKHEPEPKADHKHKH
jgi:copper(I)-binding protein